MGGIDLTTLLAAANWEGEVEWFSSFLGFASVSLLLSGGITSFFTLLSVNNSEQVFLRR